VFPAPLEPEAHVSIQNSRQPGTIIKMMMMMRKRRRRRKMIKE
jgi:hypothetical protein